MIHRTTSFYSIKLDFTKFGQFNNAALTDPSPILIVTSDKEAADPSNIKWSVQTNVHDIQSY